MSSDMKRKIFLSIVFAIIVFVAMNSILWGIHIFGAFIAYIFTGKVVVTCALICAILGGLKYFKEIKNDIL